ncbi:unnamed protein product [Paramecium primaurelia]|uniref:Tetratricopeptide repeat protein n=1 Tax=Paramecium primaurelia TaxID=5886 RepID=A0A8S1LXM1_PARPR|nr:unnamed protein product [Paramecium primaurelia]
MSKILRYDYEDVLKRNPNDIKSMIALGQKLLQQQKRNQALYWFDAAISLDPNMVDSLCGKGDALQQFDKYQKAIQWYDRALSIVPNHVPSLVGKAKALYQLELDFNKLAKRITIIKFYIAKVLNKQKTESSLFERDSLEKQKLEQRFKEKGITLQICMFFRRSNKREVRYSYERERRLILINKWRLNQMIKVKQKLIQSQAKALHQYKIEALLQGKSKPKHQIELEQEIELELESQKYFDQALLTKPNQIQALTGKGLCVNTFQKQYDAEVIINKALSLPTILSHNNDKQSDIYAAKGDILLNQQKYAEANSFYDKALELDPNHLQSTFGKGQYFRLIENYDDAIEWYDKAIKLKPNHINSIWGKGESLRMQDKFRKAIVYFDRALKYHPKHFLSLYGKGEALRMLKFNYDASVEYKQALELQPNHIKGLFGYGEVLKLMKKYQQSLVCYKKILEIDQGNMEAVQLKYEVEHCISQLQQKESINTLRKQDLQSNSKFFDGLQTNTVNFRKKL